MKDTRFEHLRSRAERILSQDESLASRSMRGSIEELLHELDLYRVELELQNQELRFSQGKLEKSRSRYLELYNLGPALCANVSETPTP